MRSTWISSVHTAAAFTCTFGCKVRGKATRADSRTTNVLAGCDPAGIVSGLVIKIRVSGTTVKCALCVCVWVARGVRVNWCCVLKVVNKVGEHPRSSCEMHTNTRSRTSQSQTDKLYSVCKIIMKSDFEKHSPQV